MQLGCIQVNSLSQLRPLHLQGRHERDGEGGGNGSIELSDDGPSLLDLDRCNALGTYIGGMPLSVM